MRVIHLDKKFIDQDWFAGSREDFLSLLSDIYKGEDFGEMVQEKNLVLVGGQASALWYHYYFSENMSLMDINISYSSDVDLTGIRASVQFVKDKINPSESSTAKDFDPSVSLAKFISKPTPNFPKGFVVDILANVYGVNDAEFKKGVESIDFDEEDLSIPIINPYLCLKSRVANFFSLFKKNKTQELYRVEVGCRVLSCYLNEILDNGWDKRSSALIESVIDLCKSQASSDLFVLHNIDLLAALDLDRTNLPEFFMEKRLPSALAEVESIRVRRLLHLVRFNNIEPLSHCSDLVNIAGVDALDRQRNSRPRDPRDRSGGIVYDKNIDIAKILSGADSKTRSVDDDPTP